MVILYTVKLLAALVPNAPAETRYGLCSFTWSLMEQLPFALIRSHQLGEVIPLLRGQSGLIWEGGLEKSMGSWPCPSSTPYPYSPLLALPLLSPLEGKQVLAGVWRCLPDP